MSKHAWTRSLWLAGALGAGAVALPMQATAADTSDVPLQAGEASTMTHGVPNLLTTNFPYADRTIVLLTPVAVPAVVNSPDAYAPQAMAPQSSPPGVMNWSSEPAVIALVPATVTPDGVVIYTQ